MTPTSHGAPSTEGWAAPAVSGTWPRRTVSARLPDFPWDTIAGAASRARAHPDGIVDLSVGTPVDSVPAVVQEALRAAADWPGYPTALGTHAVRAAAGAWLERRLGVVGVDPTTDVIPTIGSKELISWAFAFLFSAICT